MTDRRQVDEAVALLRAGGLVALPTETVYGLAADAQSEVAVRRIFAAKGRPASHPLIVHLPGPEHLGAWARELPEEAARLAEAFWPGPLTLVLKKGPRVPHAITGGQDTVAVRVPKHPLARAVLQAFGGGLAAPSANRFGQVSPTTAEHVRSELGGRVDLILDGGPCEVGVESTIVDLSRGEPVLLRPGGLPVEEVERVLGRPVRRAQDAEEVRAPGTLASHYAPRAGLELRGQDQVAQRCAELLAEGKKVAAVVPPGAEVPEGVVRAEVPADPAGFARALYATLRELDGRGADVIVAVPPPDSGLGMAVRDRLRRAAAPREPRSG